MADCDPERILYLAIPLNAYNEFFTRPFIQSVIQRGQVSLIVYDVENSTLSTALDKEEILKRIWEKTSADTEVARQAISLNTALRYESK